MLITPAQMRILDADVLARFVRRLSDFIDSECDFSRPYDGSSVPPEREERVSLVAELVTRAKGYGIVTERGLAQFVVVGLGYARTFDRHPAVRKMLQDASRTPDENIQCVVNAVVVAEARRHHVEVT